MDRKERHERENESREVREAREARDKAPNEDMISESLLANGKKRRRNDTGRTNRMWLWLGVLILVFILLWWLWTIGIFGDLNNSFNG